MYGMHLALGNIQKISLKTYFMENFQIDVLRTSQGRHAAFVTLGRF